MAGESAEKFLEENVTLCPNGSYKLTQKQYISFMNSKGVTKEAMATIAAANRELFNGLYAFANKKLAEAVDADKGNGNDGKKQKVEVNVTIPNGTISLGMESYKSYPVPQSDKRVDKTNVTKLLVNPQRALDKEVVKSAEDAMKAKLGI